MSDYAATLAASRRLALLRVLAENEGAANESVLRTALCALGFRGRLATDESLAGDLDVLAKAGLLVIEDYLGRVRIATITKRGARYLARQVDPVEGVEYPAIGA